MKEDASPKDTAVAVLAESMSEWNPANEEVACVSMTCDEKMVFCFLPGEKAGAAERLRNLIDDVVNDDARPEPMGLLLLRWRDRSFVEARTRSFCTDRCRAEGCDGEAILRTLDGRYFSGTIEGKKACLPWPAESGVQ